MNLSVKILISLVLSVIVGLIAGAEGLPFIKWWIAPIGTMFINLIKMVIVPVVFTSLVVGMTSLGDLKKLGRIGIKTILIYLCTTAIAIIIGFAVAGVGHPGIGLEMAAGEAVKVKEAPSIMQVLVAMIPTNPVASMGMAAGALVQLAGGTPEIVGNAVALAIKNLLGLACDPVAGLVEVPCVKRNGFIAVHAMVAADMAMAGVQSVIPVDDVIDAMNRIGRSMPSSIKETAEGGLATTKTGLRLTREIFGK